MYCCYVLAKTGKIPQAFWLSLDRLLVASTVDIPHLIIRIQLCEYCTSNALVAMVSTFPLQL